MRWLLFAGTSEGRQVAQFCAQHGVPAEVFVATEYGELTLPSMPTVQVHCGRLTQEQMQELFTEDAIVIDATHPYADQVTANIREACDMVGCIYIRLVRPRVLTEQEVVCVPDTISAAAYLDNVTGSALLTTGSKELAVFTQVKRYAERLYPRVLPTADVLQKCTALGFSGRNLIAMQGPFSKEMNIALLRQTQAKYLVTKDTGEAGGFSAKMEAAKEAGVTVLLITRPTQEKGFTLAETLQYIKQECKIVEQTAIPLHFPLFVSLKGKKVAMFGAGKIAARRVNILRQFGADVRVTAPDTTCALQLDNCRGYLPTDLEGVFLAVAATNDRQINHAIAQQCDKAGILCSVADCAEESTFFFPAICTGNGLTAGIVSDGTRHSATAKAAARIRRVLEEEECKP